MTAASASLSPRAPGSGAATTAGTREPTAVSRPLQHLRFEHAQLLEGRGLATEVCQRMGLTSAIVPGGGDWVCFPSIKHGKVVNRQYKRLDAKAFIQDRGGEQCWWNHDCLLDKALADHPLIVTEGAADALCAIQSGFQRVVSVPGGAPAQAVQGDGGAKYAFLADTLPLLREVRQIILATDGDGPGVILMNDLAMRLGRGRCKFLEYPAGCKDLNDVLLAHGEAGVVDTINRARWTKVAGLYLMSELPPVEDVRSYDIDMPALANHYRLRRKDFCVITGIPGHGKSTFVNDLICRVVDKHDLRACFASFEQNPQIDHKRALVRWKTGRPFYELSPLELGRVEKWIDSRFSFVIPDEEEDADLGWIIDKLASAVVRYGAEICVIDPWNELDHARPKDLSLTEYVGRSIRELKRFAARWNVHMIVVAHPTKMSRDKDGTTPMPTLYDISDSAHFFNKPDIGIVVHREGPNSLVRVCKSRYHDSIGKPGTACFSFNERNNHFEESGAWMQAGGQG